MPKQKYNKVTKCVKCGHHEAITRHCDGFYRCFRFPFEPGDHIDRECTNCGYQWIEASLDAEG